MRNPTLRLAALLAAVGAFVPTRAQATPAFARSQDMACTVCHTVFPELNQVGRTFKEDSYRFPDPENKEGVVTNGLDLGGGVKIDKLPGIAFRIESLIIAVSADPETGNAAVSTQPLDAAELIATGVSGDHWSYMAEIASSADNAYVPEGNGLIQYRVARPLSIFAGWVPMFQRDGYNQLSESRRVDNVEHAVGDYAGSMDLQINSESGLIGATGRAGPVFYIAEVTPGPGIIDPTSEPLDFLLRVEGDIDTMFSAGGFVYSGNTATDDTVRVALDFQALTDAGNFKVVGMYDTLDQVFAAEAGWNFVSNQKSFVVIPQARVDLITGGGATSVDPTIGVALQRSTARLQLEVRQPLGGPGPVSVPDIALRAYGVF